MKESRGQEGRRTTQVQSAQDVPKRHGRVGRLAVVIPALAAKGEKLTKKNEEEEGKRDKSAGGRAEDRRTEDATDFSGESVLSENGAGVRVRVRLVVYSRFVGAEEGRVGGRRAAVQLNHSNAGNGGDRGSSSDGEGHN